MNFLQKYDILRKSIPVPATFNPDTIESDYVDDVVRSKNCHYCFFCQIENGAYSFMTLGKNLVDCNYVLESEKIYQSVDCNNCYSSTFLMNCNDVTDCHYSAFLNSCNDCFGCVAITHKKYCIFNRQYSKEDYLKGIEELKRKSPSELLAQMLELKKQIPHPASQQNNNENCPYGDYIYDSKNSYWCFNSSFLENCGYFYNGGPARNSWDMYFSGGDLIKKDYSQFCYQNVGSDNCYHCFYMTNSENCSDCFYGERLLNCADCFGCIDLKNKKYCVLNNQLTKDEYVRAVKDIKKELGWKV